MVFVFVLAVTIWAFDPTMLGRDLQPNARMTQCTFATVTSDAIAVYNLGFWRINTHHWILWTLNWSKLLCVIV